MLTLMLTYVPLLMALAPFSDSFLFILDPTLLGSHPLTEFQGNQMKSRAKIYEYVGCLAVLAHAIECTDFLLAYKSLINQINPHQCKREHRDISSRGPYESITSTAQHLSESMELPNQNKTRKVLFDNHRR